MLREHLSEFPIQKKTSTSYKLVMGMGMGKGREAQLGGDICVIMADLLEKEMV